MKRESHVGDDRLVTACLEGPSAAETAHFDACEVCAARRRELMGMLEDVSDAAHADTDAVFTEERLAAQRGKILQRIAHAGHQGRVIAFPSTTASASRLFRTRPSSRWVAAAAAAGLAIGLLVGRLSNPGMGSQQSGLTASARVEPAGAVFLPAAIRLTDDEFLGEVEYAVNGPTEVLRPLHELTPLAEQFAALEQ